MSRSEPRPVTRTAKLLARLGGAAGAVPGAAPHTLLVRVPSWLGLPSRHPENCEAPLDLGYVSTMVENAGLPTAILDLETGLFGPDDVVEAVRSDRPTLVVLKGTTPATDAMLRLARSVREVSPEIVVAACGQQADAAPSAFLHEGSPVDLCTVGEFEETLVEVALRTGAREVLETPGTRRFSGGRIVDNARREAIADLDALPRPAHRFFLNPHYRYLHPMQRLGPYRWGFVQAGRGCPFPCSYCSSALRTTFGSRVRSRSPGSVAAEVLELERQGVNVVVFTDDLFNSSRERVLELCDGLRTAGVTASWTAEGRATPADPEMFRSMRAAGCSTYSMGVESGSQTILDRLDKRVRVEEIERAFRLAREAGLLTVGFFMVGSPGETEEDFQASLRLMARLDPDIIQVAFFTCYPGSSAHDEFRDRLPTTWSRFQHYETFVNLSAADDETVRRWQRTLYARFLMRPHYILRYLRIKHVNLLLNFRAERYLAEQALRTLMGSGQASARQKSPRDAMARSRPGPPGRLP